jgi:hypothetical protein
MASSEPNLGTVVADLREFWAVALANLTRELLAENCVCKTIKRGQNSDRDKTTKQGLQQRKKQESLQQQLRANALQGIPTENIEDFTSIDIKYIWGTDKEKRSSEFLVIFTTENERL